LAFCWFTSYIGYPDFFGDSGNAVELAQSFHTLAKAGRKGITYSASKSLFPGLDHAQVETKKAAFQEYGLLYVEPASNKISVTPLGKQIQSWTITKKRAEDNRRTILFALARALARYQFNNPLPVGGNRFLPRAKSSDVRPYLVSFYLLHRLGGFITASEFFGPVSALQYSKDLGSALAQIKAARKAKKILPPNPALPAVKRTADNLKIYFFSHLSLAWNILKTERGDTSVYGKADQLFQLTELGYEMTAAVLDSEWPNWKHG
jgi:hypothetical protein